MPTAVIQIGNSDDKLTQIWWNAFYEQVHEAVTGHGKLHFAGTSPAVSRYQNACWVTEISNQKKLHSLRAQLANLAHEFGQDSIALTVGDTTLLSPRKRRT